MVFKARHYILCPFRGGFKNRVFLLPVLHIRGGKNGNSPPRTKEIVMFSCFGHNRVMNTYILCVYTRYYTQG